MATPYCMAQGDMKVTFSLMDQLALRGYRINRIQIIEFSLLCKIKIPPQLKVQPKVGRNRKNLDNLKAVPGVTPLIIDANAVLTFTFSRENLQWV
jgi:hypothetical protein